MIQIETVNISKSYGKLPVLEKLNINLSSDFINFIFCPNSSGKSTLLKCIMKVIKISGRYKGNDVAISYMPETTPFTRLMSAWIPF